MTTIVVPSLDEAPWPTLGPSVCSFIETHLVFGPGDLRGEPAKLDDEKRALIYRAYEVYPADHPWGGRRRFRRVAFSLRKGSAKTELAAWIAACELHPDAPVRFHAWEAVHGAPEHPVGVGVTDPYIPMVAYTEEQSEDLAYGALRVILGLSPLRDDFDIGLERIIRREGDGKAVALASAPDARDGARTTWQHLDETHRFTLPRLKAAHRTMLANLPKRRIADPWSLETTTAPAPGENSVAEDTMAYAQAVAAGDRDDARLFFFHRQAGGAQPIPLDTREQIRAAVVEASGPVAEWSDIDGIVDQWDDPTADRAYLERVWLNRLVQMSGRAFDPIRWAALARPEYAVPDGALVTLGFDGSRFWDATGIVGCEVATGHLFVVAVWERPPGVKDWEVPVSEVRDAVAAARVRFNVFRLIGDESKWESEMATWYAEFGDWPHPQMPRVYKWPTNAPRRTGQMFRSFANAIASGELSHDGDEAFARHIANACKKVLQVRDDDDKPLWWLEKERPDSLLKIDLCYAAAMAWEGRKVAIENGVSDRSVYETRGALVF